LRAELSGYLGTGVVSRGINGEEWLGIGFAPVQGTTKAGDRELLREHGYQATRMIDGVPDWKAARLPVESALSDRVRKPS
jgi:hypothetical protein